MVENFRKNSRKITEKFEENLTKIPHDNPKPTLDKLRKLYISNGK